MLEPSETTAIEATDKDFQQKVVDRSREIAVLVDFWAPWCQPCKTLGPLLDRLTGEYSGRMELVKVNMDENPMLAQALAISSIPAVKLIVNGEIKDQFEGALPEPELRAFLERNLPTDSDSGAVSALKLWFGGQKEQAAVIFQQLLQAEPDNPVGLVGMGLALIERGQLEEARQITEKVSEFDLDHLPEKEMLIRGLAALRAQVFLVENAGTEPADPADSSLDGRFLQACQLALAQSHEAALEGFLAIVQENRGFKDDAGRRGMLAMFDLLPEESPLLNRYRSRLSSLLFS